MALVVNFDRSCFNASLAISYIHPIIEENLFPRKFSKQTSADNTANRSGVMMPRRTLIRRSGFFLSFKLATHIRVRFRYFMLVPFSSLKIATDRKKDIFQEKIDLPSSTRAAMSAGSADRSGSSAMEKVKAKRWRDFNLK